MCVGPFARPRLPEPTSQPISVPDERSDPAQAARQALLRRRTRAQGFAATLLAGGAGGAPQTGAIGTRTLLGGL